MSRSHRLFHLLQSLRRHRGVVSGAVLAREVGVSLRTIRRDIATLQAMGAEIDAEAGVGYALRPGFLLPPLSFNEEELHALVIGAEWVARQTDAALAAAVRNAMAKIEAVLAPKLHHALDGTSFYVGSPRHSTLTGLDLGECRRAIREQRKLRILWRSENGSLTERVIWPIMLGFDGTRRSFAGWCETEERYDVFDAERIAETAVLTERYSRNRRQMVKEWRTLAAQFCSRRPSR